MDKILEYYGVSPPGGRNWRACRCPHPDHQDRNPSASVNLDEDAFICHGCGLKGNSLKLVMEIEGCNVTGAETLCEKIIGEGYQRISRSAHGGYGGVDLSNGRPRDFERGSGILPHRINPRAIGGQRPPP